MFNTHIIFSVFNSTKTTRSLYSCIFYFVDNGVAGTKESLKLFFLFFQQHVGAYQNFRAQQIFSKPMYDNLYLLCYLVRIGEVSTGRVYRI